MIVQVQEIWLQDEQGVEYLQHFVAARIEAGEAPTFGALLKDVDGPKLSLIRRLLAVLETIFGTLSVWLVVGERPGGTALIGGAVVVGALVANELLSMRERAAAEAEEAVREVSGAGH